MKDSLMPHPTPRHCCVVLSYFLLSVAQAGLSELQTSNLSSCVEHMQCTHPFWMVMLLLQQCL